MCCNNRNNCNSKVSCTISMNYNDSCINCTPGTDVSFPQDGPIVIKV